MVSHAHMSHTSRMTQHEPRTGKVISTCLHVVHHELVGELAPVLRVHDLLVHEAVDDGDAAVRAERRRDLLRWQEEEGKQWSFELLRLG